MKWLIVIAAIVTACGPKLETTYECRPIKGQEARHDRLFSTCMNGQRKITGTDDADDFVKECAKAAKNATSSCGYQYRAVSGNEFSGWVYEVCGQEKTDDGKKACAAVKADIEAGRL